MFQNAIEKKESSPCIDTFTCCVKREHMGHCNLHSICYTAFIYTIYDIFFFLLKKLGYGHWDKLNGMISYAFTMHAYCLRKSRTFSFLHSNQLVNTARPFTIYHVHWLCSCKLTSSNDSFPSFSSLFLFVFNSLNCNCHASLAACECSERMLYEEHYCLIYTFSSIVSLLSSACTEI